MKSLWIPWCVVLLSVTALPACFHDQPSAPSLHSISGHVRLTGYLVDDTGRFAGTRVVGNADGVRVELIYGNRIVAHTTTSAGVYRFSGLGPGAYIARTQVIGGIADATEALTISSFDVAAADTLRLNSRGDLYPVPNPFGQAMTVYFELPDSGRVEVTILDLAGHTVRTLLAEKLGTGSHSVTWNALDQDGNPATAVMYWVTLVTGEDIRAQLLFNERLAVPSRGPDATAGKRSRKNAQAKRGYPSPASLKS